MATKKIGAWVAALGMELVASALTASMVQAQETGERRFLVRYRSEIGAQQKSAVFSKLGLRERKQLRERGIHVVDVPAQANADRAMAALRAQPEVESVVEDTRVQALITPNDPLFQYQWGLHFSEDIDIDAPQGWDVRRDAADTVVAITDTGIDQYHEDLAANLWTNPGEWYDGYDNDGNGYVDDVHGVDCVSGDGDPQDDHGHGTHVAGTIGAVGGNGIGVTGVAWRTQLMALKVLDASGSGWDSDIAECIDYARKLRGRGVNVRAINMSLGGPSYSSVTYEALRAAQSAGIVTAAAAGNRGVDHAFNPLYPASYPLDGVIGVAATDGAGWLAYFSEFGSDVEIAAPGDMIASTYNHPVDRYAYMSGTSMAAPHVAGAIALYSSLYPHASVAEIRTRLLATADRYPSLAGFVQSGRLDLAALLGAGSAPPTPPPPPEPPPEPPSDGLGDVPVFGKKLSIVDVFGKVAKSKLTLASQDPAIRPPAPGSSSDPTFAGADLTVFSHESGQYVNVWLDPMGWRATKNGFSFDGGAAGCRVALKPGSLSVKCGAGERFPLEAPYQGAVKVELWLGNDTRFCTEFGGFVEKDFGIGSPKGKKGKPSQTGAFKASKAPAPHRCE